MNAFYVTALGEVVQGKKIVGGSVRLNDFFKLLSKKDAKLYLGNDPKLVKRADRWAKGKIKTDLKAVLSGERYQLVEEIYDLQTVNNGRFRVYGGQKANGKEWIRLVTEFVRWSDEEGFWNRIRNLAKNVGAHMNTLHEGPHVDRKSIDNGKTWITGSNHGRQERQVEVGIDVKGMNLSEVRQKIKEVAKKTDRVWKQAGVSVI